MTKRRITVTIDEDLLEAAGAAVSAGDASSVSAWINEALADKCEQRRRLEALGEAIADYEAEFGKITLEQVEQRRRLDREEADRFRIEWQQRRAERELGA